MTRSTTILAVRHNDQLAVAGDGQVTLGESVVKATAQKIRRLYHGKIVVGFAGSAADSFALLERFEQKLQDAQGNIVRGAYELARDWRTDRTLRRLEAMLVAADADHLLLISGSGDVIEPDDGVLGIGSGGAIAAAAARALVKHSELGTEDIAREALLIASQICIYTNDQIHVETIQ